MLTLTDNAVRQFKAYIRNRKDQGSGIRIFATGGG
jgi:Fe-S cluster assembly iron-binding protein IscA